MMTNIKNSKYIDILLILLATVPIVIWPSHQYSGDGIVYSNSILENRYIWNPNHLLVQPVGLVFYNFLRLTGLSIHPFDAQVLLAVMSSLLSLLIFWIVLKKLIIPDKWYSVLFAAGFIYSNYFLALSESSEFLMVQMPFLMSLFFISCWFINRLSNNTINEKESVEAALLLSVFITLSTLFFVSNVFIVIGLLMSFLLASTDKQSRRKALTAGLVMVFVSCLLTGGLFYSIWLLSVKPSSGVSFLTWITSYRGGNAAHVEEYGGIILNIKDTLLRCARMVFAFLQNIAFAELGSAVKSKLTSSSLDCIGISLSRLIWWSSVYIVIAAFFLLALIITIKNIVKDRISPYSSFGILYIGWIVSFLPFNFFWNNSDDQFWFQITPAIWSILAVPAGLFSHQRSYLKKSLYIKLVSVLVAIIILNNIIFAVLPRNQFNAKYLAHKLADYFKEDITLIWPGNDRWGPVIYLAEQDAKNRGYSLKALPLVSIRSEKYEKYGPEKVIQLLHDRLATGQRVFLLRVAEPDDELVPWSELKHHGLDRTSLMIGLRKNYHLTSPEKIYKFSTLVEVKN